MSKRLDPYFETLFLLPYPEWGDKEREEAVAAIDDFGLDGSAFYAANFPLVERYCSAFRKHRVESPGTKILDDVDQTALFAYTTVFLSHREWFEGMGRVSEKAAHDAVEAAVVEMMEGERDIVRALESAGFTDQARWQIMALLRQPKQRLASISQAVRDNIPAFEFAAAQVKPELDVMLAKFGEQERKQDPAHFIRISRSFDPHAEVVPTLALPLGVVAFEGACFYGLLVNQMLADKELGYSKGELILGAKALGDTSKIEILLALKEGSLYNLEIANRVGLTPATASHHMGILLAAGFVDIEKRDGKVFYSLSGEGVRRFLDGARALLLHEG